MHEDRSRNQALSQNWLDEGIGPFPFAPDAFLVLTPEFAGEGPLVLCCSDGCQELTGYSAEELCGRRVAPFLGLSTRAGHVGFFRPGLDSSPATSGFASWRSPNGNAVSVQWRLSTLRDLTGKVTQLQLALQPEAPRPSLTLRLDPGRAEAAKVRDLAGVGSFTIDDPSTGTLNCNQEMLDLWGLSAELRASDMSAFMSRFHPEDVRQVSMAMQGLMKDGRSVDLQHRIILPDGSIRTVQLYATVVPGGVGVPRVFGVVVDVTDRLRAEAALHDAERRFLAASEASLDGLGLLCSCRDDSGTITDFEVTCLNGRSAELFARPHDQVLGMRICELLPRLRTLGYFERLVNVVQSGKPFEQIIRNQSPELKLLWAHLQVVRWGDGLAVTVRDVSDQQALADSLLRAQRMECVGMLAAGIAHDFNNMLCAVLAIDTVVRSSLPVDSQAHSDLSHSLDAASRASRLARRLLEFSREQIAEPRLTDVGVLLCGLADILYTLAGRTVELSVETQQRGLWVMVDPSQLEQTIVNLVVNARDAMLDGGKLDVGVELVAPTERVPMVLGELVPGRHVRISVADTGTGIEPGLVSQIFLPHFTTKQASGGTGLGLASVWSFVRQSNGCVDVSTAVGRGSTFSVYLPQAANQPHPNPKQRWIGVPKADSDPPPVSGQFRRTDTEGKDPNAL